MGAPDILAGLARSPFLADAEREREPGRLAITIAGGLGLGFVSALACWLLILAPYTVLIGKGAEGLDGLSQIASRLTDAKDMDPHLATLRMLVATITDASSLLAFVAVAAAVAHRPLHIYVTAAPLVRWRLAALGLVMAAVVLSPLAVVDRLLAANPQPFPVLAISPDGGERLIYALSSLLLIPAAAAEEIFFRGWLLRQFAAFTRGPGLLMLATGTVFAALHLDFNPDAFLTRAVMGVGLAYMTLRLGGVEFAAGAHAANNMLVVLFLQPLTASTLNETGGISGGSVAEDLFMMIGYVAITEAVVRTPALRRWAGLAPGEISPPDVEGSAYS